MRSPGQKNAYIYFWLTWFMRASYDLLILNNEDLVKATFNTECESVVMW